MKSTAIAKYLKKARVDLGINQQEMAAAINISGAYLSNIETGNVSASLVHIKGLSNAFDCIKLEELLDASAISQPALRIDLRSHSIMKKLTVARFARCLDKLENKDLDAINKIIEKHNDQK